MDQGVLAGVGNLLADEALWRARLARAPGAATLDAGRARPLRRVMRAATRRRDPPAAACTPA